MERRLAVQDAFLAIVGGVCVLAYILCCRPAWHPSGKSVAFPFEEEDRVGLALYDLETQTVRRLSETPSRAHMPRPSCIWTADGRQLISVQIEPEKLSITRIDPGTHKQDTVARLDLPDDLLLVQPPVLVADRFLWLGPFESSESDPHPEKEKRLLRFDLATKASKWYQGRNAPYVFDFGPRGLLALDAPCPEKGCLEISTFDGRTGDRKLLFKHDWHLAGFGFVAEPDPGRRLALMTSADSALTLRVLDESGTELKSLPLPGEYEDPAYAAWAGGRIWTSVERQLKESGPKQVGLLWIDPDKNQKGFIDLAGADGVDVAPAISPDGRQLAVAAKVKAAPDSERQAALLLIATGDPQPEPLKIWLPPREQSHPPGR